MQGTRCGSAAFVAVMVTMMVAGALASTTTTMNPTQQSLTTDDPTTTEVDCGPLPQVANMVLATQCQESTPGTVCAGQCEQGYSSATDLIFTCGSDGMWTLPDGTVLLDHDSSDSNNHQDATAQPHALLNAEICVDLDACASLPCDGQVSQCVDEAAPSLGYQCQCLPGFFGSPGPDGSGCARTAIKTAQGDMVVTTGTDKDVHFQLGPTLHTSVRQLVQAIQTSTSTEQVLDQRIDQVRDELSVSALSLEAVIEGEATARGAAVQSLDSKASDALASAVRDIQSDIKTTSDTLSARITSTQADVDREETRASSVEATLSSAINSVDAFAKTTNTRVTTVSNQVRSQSNMINTVKADLASESQRAKTAESGLTSRINGVDSDLGTLSSSVKANYYTKSQTYSRSQVDSKVNSVANARYTKSQVDSLISTLRSQVYRDMSSSVSTGVSRAISSSFSSSRSWTNRYFYTRATSNSRYYTRGQVDSKFGSYYTKNDLDGRMVWPIKQNVYRYRPLDLTAFMPDDDDSDNNAAFHDSAYGVFVTTSSLELFLTLEIPPGWYMTHVRVYGRDSGNDMRVFATRTLSTSSRRTVCSSGSINRNTGCSTYSYRQNSGSTPYYQFVLYVAVGSSDYIYGGYYTLRKF